MNRPFLTWAMQFAQWQTLAWLKSRRRQQRMVIDDDLAKLLAEEEAADEPAFEARRNALASCLQKLRPEQRELIARRYESLGPFGRDLRFKITRGQTLIQNGNSRRCEVSLRG